MNYSYLMLPLKITRLKQEMFSLISHYYMPHESKVTVNSKHLVRNVLDLFLSQQIEKKNYAFHCLLELWINIAHFM